MVPNNVMLKKHSILIGSFRLGPNVNGFEKDLEAFVNSSKVQEFKGDQQPETCNLKPETLTKRVVALSSGTAAVQSGVKL